MAKTIKEVIQYSSIDKERFAEEIQLHIEGRQAVDFTEQRKRMTVCEKYIGELEEMRKKEARKDKLHQNYLKRKANGKQKEYEEHTKGKKKA